MFAVELQCQEWQYYRGEYDEVKVLIHGSESPIRMGRETELLILSQKALNSPNCWNENLDTCSFL